MRPDHLSNTPTVGTPGKPRRRITALLPLLVLVVIFIAVAGQEIPALHRMIQRWIDPAAWQAGQACQQAALGLARKPEFARIIAEGAVHATQKGFYVEAVQVGEMAEQGGESQFAVSCYLDTAGQVVRADRIE